MDFTNKVILLTGTSSGIGLATTKLLLSHSAHVFGVDLHPPTDTVLLSYLSSPPSDQPSHPSSDQPSHPSPTSQKGNGRFHFHPADLSLPSSPAEIIAKCIEVFGGRIDVLLNIAGVMDSFASVGSVSEAELGKVMAVNLMAPIRLMGEAVKVMLGQGGKEVEGEVKGKEGGGGKGGVIVNVASRAASTGATAGVGYTGSKAGL
ncbi:hypothetical protein MMC10_008981, partial [Thelotrema lepadinum]|nr:hypothetical protein [Thelotrema lepadinum]